MSSLRHSSSVFSLIGTKYQTHVGANICGDSYACGQVGIYFLFKSKLNGGLAESIPNVALMLDSILHHAPSLLLISSCHVYIGRPYTVARNGNGTSGLCV